MDFTPLNSTIKPTTTGTAPALTQTSGSGMLPRIPQVAPLPKVVAPPALEKTVKGVPKATTALPSPSQAAPVGINAPVLEKTTKGVKTTPMTTGSSIAPNLRPTWPVVVTKPEAKPPQLEVSAKAKPVSQPGTRVENPNGSYIITCDVHTMGCDSVTTGVNGRKLIHGVFSYPEVMKMEGENVTEKLIAFAKKNMLQSFPPFLIAGITLGSTIVEIKYPIHDVSGDVVATIELYSAEKPDRKYRTIHIKRFRHNVFTSVEV